MRFKKWLLQESSYPATMTPSEIFDYVKSLHSYEEDLYTGNLGKRIWKYDIYILKTIPINKIKGNWSTHWPTVDDYRDQFNRTKNYPPLVLQKNLTIIDGMHRYRALLEAGEGSVSAYVGQLSGSPGRSNEILGRS